VRPAFLSCWAALALSCAAVQPAAAPERYRLAESGEQWHVSGDDRVLEDVRQRYPEFLRKVLDPSERGELDIRPVRHDLEHLPVDRRNFDALNAVAISYFELNHRAEAEPGGPGYFDNSFQAAKLLALPWKAYGLVPDPALRDAILDFFEDAGSGVKLDSASTAPRLAGIVASLEAKETDDGRLARIRDLTHQLGGGADLRPAE
jgi:hypothetical protein